MSRDYYQVEYRNENGYVSPWLGSYGNVELARSAAARFIHREPESISRLRIVHVREVREEVPLDCCLSCLHGQHEDPAPVDCGCICHEGKGR